jgi:hypothetical protein
MVWFPREREDKKVSNDHQFGLFQDNDDGPVWRGAYSNLEQAKLEAQKCADLENKEFFVYCFNNYAEVARLFPSKRKPRT